MTMFSIISVCYNCVNDVSDTIESLKAQQYKNYEYIVVDGGSSDGTLEKVHQLTNSIKKCTIISEKDRGIYDAMNKGVHISKGKYVYFLNMGDRFYNDIVLKNVAESLGDYDILYGDIQKGDSVLNQKNRLNLFNLIYREWMVSHQSIFAKRSIFMEHEFDLSYSVCADREWMIRVLKCALKNKHIPIVIAYYDQGGISSNYIKFKDESLKISEKYGGVFAKYLILLKRRLGTLFKAKPHFQNK